MVGRVLCVCADRFSVDTPSGTVTVKSRKKNKRALPLSGDFAELERSGDEYVLEGLCPRANFFVRPPVANVDTLVVTVAPLPEADLLTVDKMLIVAHKAGVRTVLCVNKTDVAQEDFFCALREQYEGVASAVVQTCAVRGDAEALRPYLHGLVCLSGQSAVGKTSLINALCGTDRPVGELSEKTLRGKNTTVGVHLLPVGDGAYIADTPGFGSLDVEGIAAADLPLYYDEYVRIADGCRYRMCSHTIEPDCAVRAAVEKGELSRARYARYGMLLEQIKQQNAHRRSWRTTYEDK